MIRSFVVVIALAALLAASGCASPGESAASPDPHGTTAPSSAGPRRDPMTKVSSPAWNNGELEQPVPTAGSAGDLSLPWAFISLADDQQHIHVAYIAGDKYCVNFVGFRVAETQAKVELTAVGKYTSTPPASVCPAMLVQGAGTVTLSSPLGNRALYHAAVSAGTSFPTPTTSR